MNVTDLDKKLSNIADDFASEVQMHLRTSSCSPDTIDALDEIARQLFYALRGYKDAIVEYERSR